MKLIYYIQIFILIFNYIYFNKIYFNKIYFNKIYFNKIYFNKIYNTIESKVKIWIYKKIEE